MLPSLGDYEETVREEAGRNGRGIGFFRKCEEIAIQGSSEGEQPSVASEDGHLQGVLLKQN